MKNLFNINFFTRKVCIVQTSCIILFTVFSLSGAENIATLIKSGDQLVSKKKFDEAIVTYHKALKQAENPEICYKLGIAYSRLKEEAAAAHYFREAIRLTKQPTRKILYYQDLAGVYQRVHDFSGMENVYKMALQDPEMADHKQVDILRPGYSRQDCFFLHFFHHLLL